MAAPTSSMCPGKDRAVAAKVVAALLAQDYVSGLFVDDDLGTFPGTLPLSAINLKGSSVTPRPAIVINFRSYSTGCDKPVMCTVNVADTCLQQGQGMHGSFNRADTMNFMAAIGTRFQSGLRRRQPGEQCRHRQDHGAGSWAQDPVPWQPDGPGHR